MPNEPRIPTEPTLEELSAYLDHELDAATQARVTDHVAGCAECTRRLNGLRETVHAVRALPMETPNRTFTIPVQPRQSSRWAPIGWLGGAAAALLIIVVGINQLHGPGSALGTTLTSRGAAAPAAGQSRPEVAPLYESNQDAAAGAQKFSGNSTTAVDPRNSSRSLTLATDARSYSATGVIGLHITTYGLSAPEASSVRLFLIRDSRDSVRLAPPSKASTYPFSYDAAYSIPQMQLQTPVAGNYTLRIEIDLSDGTALVAQLPLTITP
ncbi:MAG TPA: zf-HC2 domain-containing protein [Candidatus Dormibacteraeota bacterium]|nr:zf-HC2 domain-containing protein [Candidatus Dormibacteraeota bacterium]